MSYKSPASEAIDKAEEHINDAIKELSKIVIEEVSGTDELAHPYLITIQQIFPELLDIKQKLK